jgi:NitT/TauT family transport system substrate-binding protein
MRVRLYENYRFVLYAPFYAAHALGAYEEAGVEVELLPSPGPGKAEAALVAGEAEAMWMGPIRIMKAHEQDTASPLTAFAEVVCRDPFSLVGGTPNPRFRHADLLGKRFASVSEVPTPWLCLAGDLHQAGIDPARLERVIGRGMGENVAGLTLGELDVVQLFEPFVEEAVRRGAQVWLPASARGRTAYTVFATTRQRLDADPEPFRRMVRAVFKTQQWVEANPPNALAELVAGYFPDLDRSVLAGSLTRYKAQGVWAANPLLSEEGFDRLQRALLASGFLARSVPFADCADNSLAEEAVAGN